VRVTVKFQDQHEKKGIIAAYGTAWAGSNHICVPVELDDGATQQWQMSNMAIDT